MRQFILILVLISSFILSGCFIANNCNYCTSEVIEKGHFIETELECKLVQLTLDYIKLKNLDFNIEHILACDKEYQSFYRTLTILKSKEDKPWNIKTYTLDIWFDKDFNIVQVK